MAKECVNCGKKLTLFEDTIKLVYEKAYFCEHCGKEATSLLYGVQTLVDREKLDEVERTFAKELSLSKLTNKAKNCIRNEFNSISEEFHTDSSAYMIRRFYGSFEESYEAVRNAGIAVSMEEKFSNPPIIETGDTKIVTFVFECYFIRSQGFASLTATLVHHKGISTVITVGSGGGAGLVNTSWGAEEDFVQEFWIKFKTTNPHFVLEDVSSFSLEKSEFETVIPEKKLGIFGGSFDPIHNGHVTLAVAAIEEAALDELLVMPAHVQPFKIGKEVADDHHRLEMCKLAFDNVEKAAVSDYEMSNTEVSYTYDTLTYMKSVYSDYKIHFITGTDSFLEIEYWKKGVELLRNFSFIVSVRPGYKESALEDKIRFYREKYNTDIIKLYHEMPDISSTKIKSRLDQNLSISHMVPESVERYIHEHKLY